MNKEEILQHEIVVSYNNTFPELRGSLFAVRNISLSQRDAVKQKSIGMVKGVADLIWTRKNNTIVGIEVKHPDMDHSRDHIESQLRWGEMITSLGGRYFIVNSLAEFWKVIDDQNPKYTIEGIKQLLKTSKSKIKFI